ncbi:hypothetical protein A9Q99_01670 [Gammaproteobacteria bacterium 45_16_T64]|nr:hypothetical protein A9Q99_01670 [Gammaproteobacteria bacterium 45_16_T64]
MKTTKNLPFTNFFPKRLPLWLQIPISLAICLLCINMLTSLVIKDLGSGFLFRQIDQQNQHVLSFLAATAMDAVISEDRPILSTVVSQSMNKSPNMLELTIVDEKGTTLVQKKRTPPTNVSEVRHYNIPIVFEAETFGSITAVWNLDPVHAEIERQVSIVRLFTSTTLMLLAGLMIIFFYLLAISPINIISRYLTSLSKGDRSPLRLSIFASKELELLAKAANDLYATIKLKEQKESELLKTREELQVAHDEALGATRAKSGFLATMSHEIRTPMNAVLGILGLLRDTELTPKQRLLVQTGRDSGEHLLTIINDILDFSKMEADRLSLENTDFNLKELLDQTIKLLTPQAKRKSLDLGLSLSPTSPTFVKGDPDRLRQILLNLINNAIKFTPTGSVTLSCFTATNNTNTHIVHFAIEDTGIGIPTHLQQDLFDEFTMVDHTHSRHHEGTGLGLAICKRLVSLMKGEISFTSQENIGSIFTFTASLEATQGNRVQSRPHVQTSYSPKSGTRTLLVEDNPANQFVIKNILNYAGLKVDIAANGQEALEAIIDRPYDIILMDISMPVMDGISATKAIRELSSERSQVPIIALTAHALSGDKQRYLDAGMDDYLEKPINREATLECIGRWSRNTTPKRVPTIQQPPVQEQVQHPNQDNLLTVDQYSNIDTSIPEQLIERTSSLHATELIELFISDCNRRINRMLTACNESGHTLLISEAKTVSGTAHTYGFHSLYTKADNIVSLCNNDRYKEAYQEASTLSSIKDQSLSELKDWTDQNNSTFQTTDTKRHSIG